MWYEVEGMGRHTALPRALVCGCWCLPERRMQLWSLPGHERRRPGWQAGEKAPDDSSRRAWLDQLAELGALSPW